MSENTAVRKLPVINILSDSFEYIKSDVKKMSAFTFINFIFLFLCFEVMAGWASPFFLIWIAAYYVLWTYFFRYYFGRKPYFMPFKGLADSLIPSTKILVIGFIILTVLVFVPFIPLFVLPLEQVEQYENFLKNYMQDSTALDLFLNVVVLLFSPIIFFRPFMAWISSVIGRSGMIKTAFTKTENNHWRMVFIALVLNIPFALLTQIEFMYQIPNAITWFIASPFIVYANVVVAKAYEFFYLEN